MARTRTVAKRSRGSDGISKIPKARVLDYVSEHYPANRTELHEALHLAKQRTGALDDASLWMRRARALNRQASALPNRAERLRREIDARRAELAALDGRRWPRIDEARTVALMSTLIVDTGLPLEVVARIAWAEGLVVTPTPNRLRSWRRMIKRHWE